MIARKEDRVMDSETITIEQAQKLTKILYPAANLLIRLRERMERRGFPPNDRLYRCVFEAQQAMQSLTTEVHYLWLGPGGGRVRPPVQRKPAEGEPPAR
jgi:hypothetical protein